jgi:hypothetical protein
MTWPTSWQSGQRSYRSLCIAMDSGCRLLVGAVAAKAREMPRWDLLGRGWRALVDKAIDPWVGEQVHRLADVRHVAIRRRDRDAVEGAARDALGTAAVAVRGRQPGDAMGLGGNV